MSSSSSGNLVDINIDWDKRPEGHLEMEGPSHPGEP